MGKTLFFICFYRCLYEWLRCSNAYPISNNIFEPYIDTYPNAYNAICIDN